MAGGSVFDQRGQQVINQNNAAGNISVGQISSKEELVEQLRALASKAGKAKQELQLSEGQSTDVKENIEKAAIEIEKSQPNKSFVKNFLNNAQGALVGVTAATELASTLNRCIDKIDAIFH